MPVVIGCTTFTPSHSIELGRHAARSGPMADVHSAALRCAAAREIVAFYKAISDKVELPVIVCRFGHAAGASESPGISLPSSRRSIGWCPSRTAPAESCAGDAGTLEGVGDELRISSGFVGTLRVGAPPRHGKRLGDVDGGGLAAPFGVAFYVAVWRDDDAGREARDLLLRKCPWSDHQSETGARGSGLLPGAAQGCNEYPGSA